MSKIYRIIFALVSATLLCNLVFAEERTLIYDKKWYMGGRYRYVGLVNEELLRKKYPDPLPVTDWNSINFRGSHPWESRDWTDSSVIESQPTIDAANGNVLILVHPEYSQDSSVNRALQSLIGGFQQSKGQIYVLFYDFLSAINYPIHNPAYQNVIRYVGPEGVHRLSFTRTNSFVVAGGNWGACHCTTISRLIQNNPTVLEYNFVIPMTATFTNPCESTAKDIRAGRFPTGYTRSQAMRLSLSGVCKTQTVSLKEVFEWGGREGFRELFDLIYDPAKEDSDRHCLGLDPKGVSVQMMIDGKHEMVLGSGPKILRFQFMTGDL
ncbi:MAG: hypothetical protein K1X29_11350 [Bdellovibrionales bacterium]|nr:hypothetical protein [Bdellovibrionales bacterium]